MRIDQIKTMLVFVILLVVSGAAFAQKLYRWVDDEGNVHFSDKIPADASKRAYTTMNKQGVVLDRKRSQESVQADAAQKAEEEAKRRQQAAEQARQRRLDQILLDTFTTEKDLLFTRDERLNMIDSMINLTDSNNQALEKQIQETQSRIDFLQSNNKEIPDNTKKKLENLLGQKQKNTEFIDSKKSERKALENQFARDLARFRALKSGDDQEQPLGAGEDTKSSNKDAGGKTDKGKTNAPKKGATALNDDL